MSNATKNKTPSSKGPSNKHVTKGGPGGVSIENLKIVTERYSRGEGAKNVVLHSKLHRARGG